MSTQLATTEGMVALIPVQQIKANRQIMQQLIREVMKKGVHYDTIPGTDKDSLLKPGSEAILSMFRLAVRPFIEDLSNDDHVKYRVRCDLVVMGSDVVAGSGIGECSSQEEKYQWRAAVCHEEWEEQNAIGNARIKWKRVRDGVERIEQVRVPWADIANTVLKMAKKRAQIDATLTATAASDVFTQDLDDDGNERPRAAKSAGASGETIKSNQAGLFYHKWKDKGLKQERVTQYLKEVVGVDDSRKIPAQPKKIFDDALAWIEAGGPDWPKPQPKATEQQPGTPGTAQTNGGGNGKATPAQQQPAKTAAPAQQQTRQQQPAQQNDPSLSFSPFPDDDDKGDAYEPGR